MSTPHQGRFGQASASVTGFSPRASSHNETPVADREELRMQAAARAHGSKNVYFPALNS